MFVQRVTSFLRGRLNLRDGSKSFLILMSKCKFCKEQAFLNVKKYGYHRFSVCKNCFHWLLIELDNLEDSSKP